MSVDPDVITQLSVEDVLMTHMLIGLHSLEYFAGIIMDEICRVG